MAERLTATSLFGGDGKDKNEDGKLQHQQRMYAAIQGAHAIQRQRDIESKILELIEDLTELPFGAEPTPSEIDHFLDAISIFRPSDYDDLCEERSSQQKCGYTLCSAQLKTGPRSWRENFSQQYCSQRCNDRSLFIRSQLPNTPASERARVKISAMEYHRRRDEKTANAELAFERGESLSSSRPAQVMTAAVVEKPTLLADHAAPKLDQDSFDIVEGYKPRDSDAAHDQAVSNSGHEDSKILRKGSSDGEEQQWQEMFAHLQADPQLRLNS